MAVVLHLTRSLIPDRQEPVVLRLLLLGIVAAVSGAVYRGALSLARNPHLAMVLRGLARPTSRSGRG